MRNLGRRAVLVAAVVITACAGPAPSVQPRVSPTANATNSPTAPGTPRTQPASQPSLPPAPPTASAAPSPSPATSAPTPSAGVTVPLAWAELATVGPSAREDHTWTVDPEARIAYLFGGRTAEGPANDLWAFDLATDSWSEVVQTVDTPIPAPRFGHTATWVPDVGLVIWSGQAGSTFFDDIWAYEPAANAWRELDSLGAVPAARYGSCASLGPDGELWISHGFTDTGRFDDTRSYDFESSTWTDRTPTADVPVERCLHDCFWSPGGQLVLYGGQTTGVPALGDIWTYDPRTAAWTEALEPVAPARQLYALAAQDPANYGVLVFGGGSVDGAYLDDTWTLDWGGLQMYAVEAAGPSARGGATLVLDADRGYLLFGGTGNDGLLGDLWELGRGT